MGRRAEALELALLGLLHEAPMHGYELRKRVNALLGWGRAFSYGTLYPCLKDLVAAGYLAQDDPAAATPLAGRRSRIVYRLTPAGQQRFSHLMAQAGPAAWDDERFGVHFAFFGRADTATRLRILEGRRSRLQERLDQFRTSLHRTRQRLDGYTLELQRHGLEAVEHEVRWLDDLIQHERHAGEAAAAPDAYDSRDPARTEAGDRPAAPAPHEGRTNR